MGGGYDYYSEKPAKSKSKVSDSKPFTKSASPSKSSHYDAPKSTPAAPAPDAPTLNDNEKQAMLSSFVHSADKTGIDVAFSFDTTGSMYPCLEEVRTKLQEITKRLLKDIPNIRIALIAHGDYCDHGNYVAKALDFTNDPAKLAQFAKEVPKTGGGDLPEAYEFVLREVRNLSWDPNHSRALVMIGDEIPHAPSYTTEKIFWKTELKKLSEMGIVVYGVQALNSQGATPFYSEIATQTGGFHLRLRDFSLITEMFVAVCFRATSQEKFEEYQNQVEEDGRMTSEVRNMLNEMAAPTAKKTFYVQADWWDLQYDKGRPQYAYDAQRQQWRNL
jgi:hypothetical protein